MMRSFRIMLYAYTLLVLIGIHSIHAFSQSSIHKSHSPYAPFSYVRASPIETKLRSLSLDTLENMTVPQLKQLIKDSKLQERGLMTRLKRKQDMVDYLKENLPEERMNEIDAVGEDGIVTTTKADTEEEISSFQEASDEKSLIRDLEDKFGYEGRLPAQKEEFRCGFVSIVGAPNMGKSTLMNALIKEDLCVATRRPQTTRHAILGVVTTDDCQMCLVDTPGVIDSPAYKLQEGMMEAVMGAFHDADVLLVVTDMFSTPIPDDDLFERVQSSRKPTIVVINKVDLGDKINPHSDENQEDGRTVTTPQAIAKWRSLLPNAIAILPVSASGGTDNAGVVALRQLLLGGDDVPAALRDLGRPISGMLPPGATTVTNEEARDLLPIGPPLYSQDTLTDRPERFFASEMIRAALFQTLRKEVPYCCEVRVESFKEPQPNQKQVIRMKANVVVERDSQKGIVVGKGGEQIKRVGIEARRKLEEFFQSQVMLELNVKVDKDWRKSEKRLKEYGYLK